MATQLTATLDPFQKPYMCKVPGCTKRYTDPSSLRKHVKTVHGAEAYANKKHKGEPGPPGGAPEDGSPGSGSQADRKDEDADAGRMRVKLEECSPLSAHSTGSDRHGGVSRVPCDPLRDWSLFREKRWGGGSRRRNVPDVSVAWWRYSV